MSRPDPSGAGEALRCTGSVPDFTSTASRSRSSRRALNDILGQEPMRTCRVLPFNL